MYSTTFEIPATQLKPHELRVVAEKDDLDARLSALQKFQDTEVFEKLLIEERLLLRFQAEAMTKYSFYLGERIKHFKKLT